MRGYLEKEIKQDLLDIRNGALITPILNKLVKLIGREKCYGKGYGTETVFTTSYPASTHKLPTMSFCDCERGKQLKKLLTPNA